MKAVVVHGANDLRVDERPDPVPGAGEVLIAMEWGGVCGSDLSYWRHGASGTAVLTPPPGPRPRGGRPDRRGRRRRHRTTRSGSRSPSTRPSWWATAACPTGSPGRTNLYPRIRYFGSAAFDPHTDGGFSELRVVRADQIRPLPDGVSTEHGALAEPLAVAMHAVQPGRRRCAAATSWSTGPARSARWSWPRPSTAARHRRRRRHRRRLARGRQGHGRRRGPQPRRRRHAARGRRAGVRGVRAPRRRWAACSGRPPAAAPLVQVGNLPGTAVPAVLGDLVTREITWIGAYRFVEEISDALAGHARRPGRVPADHPPVRPRPGGRGAAPWPPTAPAAAARSCCGSARSTR